VLDGAIQRSGDRLRINASLVRVADGVTIWTDRFDAAWTDVFRVEDTIAEQVGRALAAVLSGEGRARAVRRRTENVEAYEAYLKGRYFWNMRTIDSLQRALAYFQQAIDQDQRYAPAYAGLADTYQLLGSMPYAVMPASEAAAQAKAAAHKALAIDDSLAEAHASLAFVTYAFDWQWAAGEREFRRAIEINPSYVTARQWYAFNCLSPLGRHSEAIAELHQAQEVDPLSISLRATVGLAYYFAERYEEALVQYRETIEIDENFWVTYLFLGWACAQVGQFKESLAAFQTSIRLGSGDPMPVAGLGYAQALSGAKEDALRTLGHLSNLAQTRYVPASEIMAIHVALGDATQARQWLQRACEERSFKLIYLLVDPRLAPLHEFPEFQAAKKQIGLQDQD
jgi:tetratricopeptide (TPR) repeat protein